jgi:hypothetical protein
MLRTFLSYSRADRTYVEKVAAGLIARGLLPIFDHWWLRSAPADDPASSNLELKMGVNQADAFVYFDSAAARQSMYVKYECDFAMWRTCSDAPHLRMFCVLLDDPEAHVPDWFQTTLDATAGARSPDAVVADLIEALGGGFDADASPEVSVCRRLARVSDYARLRAKLCSSDEAVRRETAILLAFLDDDLDSASLSAVVRELESGLRTIEAERAVLALGKLQTKAAAAIDGVASFAVGDADPFARARAVRVLGRIGPREETVLALARIATHPTNVRKAALTELGRMGSAAGDAVPMIVQMFESTDRHTRLVALTALGNIGICSCEILVAVLKALAETERQGIAPSQFHHNAMAIMNQLAPDDSELARALLPARSQSPRFDEWFREQFPESDAAISSGVAADCMEHELRSCARQILTGCRLVGASRPY